MPEAKEADQMFVLMTAKYRVSRNTRAQWFFNQVKKIAESSQKERLEDFDDEIEIVSMLPSNYQDLVDEEEDRCGGPFLITQNTKVTFLARRYRLVFVLDLSPSMTTVDIQCNSVLFDQIFTSLSRSLRGLAQPFYVPGSRLLFQPEIFVTVLAHTPFFTSEGEQVLSQGWKLTSENVNAFLVLLRKRFDEITESVARITARANDELEEKRRHPDSLNLDALFDEEQSKFTNGLSIPPDMAMVNIFRSGLLSLQLLPPKSNAGLIVISDGMLTLPNASVLESMLTQSRNHNIACSFLRVGSSAHPHACFGYVPYTDLMKFITTATFGAYLDRCPDEPEPLEFNYTVYHRAFLAWNFQRGLHGFKSDVHWDQCRNQNRWAVNNPYFYSGNDQLSRFSSENDQKKDQQMVKNKLTKSRVANSFTTVLSCRLREGYTVKGVSIYPSTSQIEVTLVLPWKHNVNIEYVLKAPWSSKATSTMYDPEPFECYYEVSFEGSYWFLHDVTCVAKNKKIHSSYRWTAIQQFWTTLKNLSEADKFLAHLNSFSRKNGMEVPDSVRKSKSLFQLSDNSSELILSSENSAYQQFASYWKHICLLDINVWHKWMHTHRINLILEHDSPLPKHLHEPDSYGRFFHIQCPKAMASLSELLRSYSTFVLLENHSYIKFIQIPASNSQSFFVIRLTTLLPSVVLHVAFIGGTPGDLRHRIIDDLKAHLRDGRVDANQDRCQRHEEVQTSSFCVLMRKPIEKLLIRYAKIPTDFTVSFESYFTSNQNSIQSNASAKSAAAAQASADTLATLGRLLHHKRWMWLTRDVMKDQTLLTQALNALTRQRLSDGFHFAYNKTGMINMVLEIEMITDDGTAVPCVVQYILFPPQNGPSAGKEASTDNEVVAATNAQNSIDYGQIITEYWIEPQVGKCRCTQSNSPLNGRDFAGIGEAIFDQDRELADSFALEPLEELSAPVRMYE